MRTIIYGAVTDEMLVTAELFGVDATSYVTDGRSTPPFSLLTTRVLPVCPKLPGRTGIEARHYTLALNADAMIMKGYDDHMLQVAEELQLVIYQED